MYCLLKWLGKVNIKTGYGNSWSKFHFKFEQILMENMWYYLLIYICKGVLDMSIYYLILLVNLIYQFHRYLLTEKEWWESGILCSIRGSWGEYALMSSFPPSLTPVLPVPQLVPASILSFPCPRLLCSVPFSSPSHSQILSLLIPVHLLAQLVLVCPSGLFNWNPYLSLCPSPSLLDQPGADSVTC